MTETQIEKKRGRFLAVWLILLPIVNSLITFISQWLLGLLTGWPFFTGEVYTWLPPNTGFWFNIAIVIILNIVFSRAAWKWKKWGVFGLGVMSIAGSAASLFYVGIVEVVVLAILVRPVWKHFEWR